MSYFISGKGSNSRTHISRKCIKEINTLRNLCDFIVIGGKREITFEPKITPLVSVDQLQVYTCVFNRSNIDEWLCGTSCGSRQFRVK